MIKSKKIPTSLKKKKPMSNDRIVLVAQQFVDMSIEFENNNPNPTNIETYNALQEFKEKFPDWQEIKDKVFKVAKRLYSKQHG